MAAGAARLLRATPAEAIQHPDIRRLPSSSSSPTTSGHVTTSCRPCRIPSLKFPPFLWETTKTRPHGVVSRAAEQRAALITLGSAAPDTTQLEKKRRGLLRLPGDAGSADLLLPLAYEVARRLVLRQFWATRLALLTHRCWAKVAEAVIHQVVVRCQSFTLIGVAGSLVGSVPCFLEGCGVVLESFLLQFRAMSQVVDQAEIIKLLIEALDMFLIGTAMLTFGMGMYFMFYGSRTAQNPIHQRLKEGARFQSIVQAKSRFGHAILLLLQAGVLEKFKSVPLVTGLDMACFAGAVLASSAGVFLLSKMAMHPQRPKPAAFAVNG
ncbi:uncharacterized protein LOC100834051 [Brachypodium distachyon]|uniref:Uncharacterized protein n=1 Tax=Brachypodium distachyon TaxID=15368 RepID=I1GNI1_BRADI|nr:uncharacterized protein LOC100834051 [Brachypodium distachyon]KQK13302.1 hypothetical protein BRADI_1g09240v3 [Brachypodium distachyon]|eukprot:XP_003559445.1 uncharacterized protein LOC100834051 [Brachypodium distachyon]